MHLPLRIRAGTLVAVFALVGSAAAQAPPPSFEVSRNYDSGWAVNTGDQTATIVSLPVRVPGASWVRLRFHSIDLPEEGAKLRITSVLDGAQQELDARHCREWENTSAYFNGDDVQVEIVAEPRSGRCRIVLSAVTAGIPPIPSFTQCGTIDDRVLSSDPRAARAMPIGCTAWLIDDCSHNFLTAGHCSGSSLQVVQFNVPLSNPNGTVNHPPAIDQYSVDVGSKQSVGAGVGNDWGYFGVFPNPNTSLRPFQKQQATFTLAAAAPPTDPLVVIRITGYGTDSTPPQNNQVQQTSTGPYVSHSGTAVSYRTDTEGGNSGSPVIWEQQGVAVGIHTHGGCSSSGGSNNGTAIENAGLQLALATPLGQCACRGEANPYCTGKINSQGCEELIAFAGTPSATAGAGSFTVFGSQIVNNKLGLLFYGPQPASTPFAGGTRCVGGSLLRVGVQNSGGSATGADCSGAFAFDMGAHIASGDDPDLTVGATAFAQYFSRDPASASGPYGLTNGLQFTVGP